MDLSKVTQLRFVAAGGQTTMLANLNPPFHGRARGPATSWPPGVRITPASRSCTYPHSHLFTTSLAALGWAARRSRCHCANGWAAARVSTKATRLGRTRWRGAFACRTASRGLVAPSLDQPGGP